MADKSKSHSVELFQGFVNVSWPAGVLWIGLGKLYHWNADVGFKMKFALPGWKGLPSALREQPAFPGTTSGSHVKARRETFEGQVPLNFPDEPTSEQLKAFYYWTCKEEHQLNEGGGYNVSCYWYVNFGAFTHFFNELELADPQSAPPGRTLEITFEIPKGWRKQVGSITIYFVTNDLGLSLNGSPWLVYAASSDYSIVARALGWLYSIGATSWYIDSETTALYEAESYGYRADVARLKKYPEDENGPARWDFPEGYDQKHYDYLPPAAPEVSKGKRLIITIDFDGKTPTTWLRIKEETYE